MAVDWTEHRFAGGALALDVANTVVLRGDPVRSFDRFSDPCEMPHFAAAASGFRAEEIEGQTLVSGATEAERAALTALREPIDGLFREAAFVERLAVGRLSLMLAQCADSLAESSAASQEKAQSGLIELRTATALSAIALLAPERWRRIRVCANCGWLFLDRSKNGSRRWCDMAVCGNRSKTRRFYARRKEDHDV